MFLVVYLLTLSVDSGVEDVEWKGDNVDIEEL
jgi:hypothetical protein